jgi:hypothetical protein
MSKLFQILQAILSGTYSEQSKEVFTAIASSHHMQSPNKSHLLNFLQEHH